MLRAARPSLAVLVLSQYVEQTYARALVVTEAAVAKHIGSILTKLDLPPTEDDHRRVRAVLAYLRS